MDFRPLSYLKKLTSRAYGGPVWRGGSGDMVLLLAEEGRILDISASAADMIGVAGNLIGRSLYDFVRREDRAAVRAALKLAADAGDLADARRLRAEFRLMRVRRAPALAEIWFKPADQRRKITALVRNRAPEFAELRQMRAAAEKTNGAGSAPTDIMGDLGHELKTPLTAIMGFAEAMRAETFGPLGSDKYKEYADLIHSSGAHLMDLIGVMLDCAKLEAGRYALAPTLTAPGPIARECAEMVRGEAEKAGLKLVVDIAPDLPQAMMDVRAVKQILINLLSNAVKFTSDGVVELSVSEKCGALDFVVRDTGVGMNKIALAKVGRRFTDIRQNGVRGTKGLGLGVSLAFSLAKRHGGALKFDSTPGEGTTATFALPLRKGLARQDAPSAPLAAADIQSQLDRVNAYRRERAQQASAA